jgi:hypothetical protein
VPELSVPLHGGVPPQALTTVPIKAVHAPLAQPQLFEVFASSVSVALLSHDSVKPLSDTVPALVPQLIVPPAAHDCVPPAGQKELGMTIVTLPLASTVHAVLVPLAAPTVVSHDDQQLVELRSMQPSVLFQSLGKTNQLPSGDILPIAFCPLKFQLSPVLNV